MLTRLREIVEKVAAAASLTDALDLLGIAWRQPRVNAIAVSRRDGVATLDGFVGPKR